LAVACVLSSGAVVAASTQPQSATAPSLPPAPALKAEARERFDRGVRLFEKGENASALAEFKRVNELIPNPLVLYNMGLVYAAMKRPVEAVDALEEFLAKATSTERTQRRHAEEVRNEQGPRIARLLVKTEMPATVDVDGIEVGHTPLAQPIRVASGAHVVGAQAPGFLPSRKEVTLAGQVTETLTLTLLPATNRLAQLLVTSSPLGADVVVNGQKMGQTPLPASLSVAPGTVHVELWRAGYFRAERTVDLGDGARSELAFALEEDPSAPPSSRGVLRITVSESDADISIDGIPRAHGTSGLFLPVGLHALKIAGAGFDPYERTINITSFSESQLVVDLRPTAETRERYESSLRTRRIVGWTVLGTGAALAIAGGVYGLTKLKDVSDSRSALDNVLAAEADKNNRCYAQGAEYDFQGCGPIKSDAQSRVDSAVLRRNLGFIGAGVGLATAAVGGYLLLTNGDPNRYRKSTGVALTDGAIWTDGQRGYLSLVGRF
jgi:tetratricopeptide (TPR) repeat protein